MSRRWGWLMVLVWLSGARPVWAADLRLRAVYPNPPGSDSGEWIVVENTSTATVSAGLADLRDKFGSTKTYSLPAFTAQELKTVAASESGISLNNTREAVELLYQGEVVDTSPELVASQEGTVFVQLNSGWQEMNLDAYLARQSIRNWAVNVAAENENESVANDSLTPLPGVGSEMINNQVVTEVQGAQQQELWLGAEVEPTPLPYRPPRLLVDPVTRASPAGQIEWPLPPEPDYDAEMAVFLAWKRRALVGSLALLWGGLCWLVLVVPPLPILWRWWRDELLL